MIKITIEGRKQQQITTIIFLYSIILLAEINNSLAYNYNTNWQMNHNFILHIFPDIFLPNIFICNKFPINKFEWRLRTNWNAQFVHSILFKKFTQFNHAFCAMLLGALNEQKHSWFLRYFLALPYNIHAFNKIILKYNKEKNIKS